MYSREQIIAAARRQGRTEEQIEKMLAIAPKLKQAGLLRTRNDGAMAMTLKGRKFMQDKKLTPR